MSDQEIWIDVVGYEGLYEVSSLGSIRNAETLRVLGGDVDRYGYRKVGLTAEGKRAKKKVHIAVCEAFHGPRPDQHECAHLDGDPGNNREDNLVWATKSENTVHSVAHGTHVFLRPGFNRTGSEHRSSKLSENDVAAIRAKHKQGQSGRSLAKEYGVAIRTMAKIINNETWRQVEPQAFAQPSAPGDPA